MPDILRPGTGLIFMKVGTHAGEDLAAIIDRKRREIDETGYALWGYGGNTCHPLSMVQPFADDFVRRNGAIYLCMQPIVSHHFAVTERATEASADGLDWKPIPDAISVIGSRYALAISDLEESDFQIPLSRTRVAIGPNVGKRGNRYVSGRVDKGCLEVVEGTSDGADERIVPIRLTAHLTEPYAVFVR